MVISFISSEIKFNFEALSLKTSGIFKIQRIERDFCIFLNQSLKWDHVFIEFNEKQYLLEPSLLPLPKNTFFKVVNLCYTTFLKYPFHSLWVFHGFVKF